MLVSVIIPVFNRRELCKRALLSVLEQSYDNVETIVVNDGSTDGLNFEDLSKSLGRSDFKFIDLDYNYGVSYARNRGIEKSQGDWIAFLDSDDTWHKDKIKKQIEFINDNSDCRILQTKEIWVRNGVRVNPPKTHEKKSGDLFEVSLKRCMITPSSVMIKKSIFTENGYFNESIPACEDYDMWLRITIDNHVGLVDEFLMTRYGGHLDQLSSSVPVLDKYRIRSMLDLLHNKKLDEIRKKKVQKELIKRCKIVASGAEKRGKLDEYRRYKKIDEEIKVVFDRSH